MGSWQSCNCPKLDDVGIRNRFMIISGQKRKPEQEELDKTFDVVYASDDRYAVQLGVSLISLCENNCEAIRIRCFIFDGGISSENADRLRKIAGQYKLEIIFIDVRGFLEYLPPDYDSHGYNPIVFVRLLLAEYLPQETEAVLYLDCDTVVNGSLDSLIGYKEQLLEDHTLLAAVPELYMPPAVKARSIGFSGKETYYNAGVLLINLKKWRAEGLRERFLSYYEKNKSKLLYNDQDVINACCKGDILSLSPRYNISANFPYFPCYFRRIIQPAYKETCSESRDLIRHPVIIHYMGDERPWIHGNRNYYRADYERFKARTPWAETPLIYGRERYMMLYHAMNVLTRLFPWGRLAVTNLIGIYKYKWWGKE